MDVVYVLGEAVSAELRYSLRSLQNLPHDKVWAAGGNPDWANLRHIPTVQTSTKHRNSSTNLRAAVHNPGVSEDFLLFNDDFYIVEPLDHMPVLNRGPLAAVLAWYESVHPDTENHPRPYTRGMRNTFDLLTTLGYENPLSYELHVPLPVNRTLAARQYEYTDRLIAEGTISRPLHWRTLYGNLNNIGGDTITDVKVYKRRDLIPPGPFVSTSDTVFRFGTAGRQIKITFRHPCDYETDRITEKTQLSLSTAT